MALAWFGWAFVMLGKSAAAGLLECAFDQGCSILFECFLVSMSLTSVIVAAQAIFAAKWLEMGTLGWFASAALAVLLG